MIMPFVHELKTRFFESDRAGIVFFGRVFEYCHQAFEEMLAAAFGQVDAVFNEHGFGMPLVHCEADFKRPMRMGETLRVSLEVERLGERSITFAYTLADPAGAVRATARLVHAFIDFASFTPIPTPEAFRAGLGRVGLLDERPKG